MLHKLMLIPGKLRNLEKVPVRRQEVIKEQLRVMQEEQKTKDNAGIYCVITATVMITV